MKTGGQSSIQKAGQIYLAYRGIGKYGGEDYNVGDVAVLALIGLVDYFDPVLYFGAVKPALEELKYLSKGYKKVGTAGFKFPKGVKLQDPQKVVLSSFEAQKKLKQGFIIGDELKLVIDPKTKTLTMRGYAKKGVAKQVIDQKLLDNFAQSVAKESGIPMVAKVSGNDIVISASKSALVAPKTIPTATKVVSAGKVVIPKAEIKPQKAQGEVLPTKTTKVSPEVKPALKSAKLDTLNPTGSVFADYTPAKRATAELADNITTLDKTMKKPADEMITIYRGTGKGGDIVAGDFVTTNKQLAKDYAGTGRVIEKKVKLSDILDDLDEPLGEEYIYRPQARLKPSQEARKYGSAEEFVKAQGKNLYHGTNEDIKIFSPKTGKEKMAGEIGTYFTTNINEAGGFGKNIIEARLDKNTKIKQIYDNGKPDKYIAEELFSAKNEGYDAVEIVGRDIQRGKKYILQSAKKEIEELGPKVDKLADEFINGKITQKEYENSKEFLRYQELINEIRPNHFVVFNTTKIKTKSQLTEIWNKAHKEVKKPTLPKRQPPKNIPPKKPAVVKSKTANTEPKKTTLPKPIQKTQSIQPKKPSLPKPKKSDIIKAKETPKTKIIPKTSELKAKKEKEEFTSKVFERMQAENPELLKGDLKATKIYLDNESKKAIKLMEKDKQAAYNLAMGREESSDVLGTSVNIAMTEKALEEGNNELAAKLIKNRSLAQTRRGQELVAEKGSITDNSTSRYVKELLSNRLDKLGDKYTDGIKDVLKKGSKKENAINKIEKEIANVEIAITNKKLDTKTALALLEKMTCI